LEMKIAVCISGLLQHWDLTSQLFRYWNSISDEMDFTFFLSTWKEDSEFPSTDNQPGAKDKVIRDSKFSEKTFDFLEMKEFLSTDVIPKDIMDEHTHTGPFSSYQIYNVQKMRKKYEENADEKFDVVVQTREDMFIPRKTLDQIIFWFNSKQIVSGMFFTTSGTKVVVHRGNKRGFSFSVPNDNFSFAHPDAMNEFSQMYNDCYVEKTNGETFGHFMHAQQLMNKGIYNCKIGNEYHTRLIRTGKLQKPGFPTDKSLKRLIDEKGVDWIYGGDDIPQKSNIYGKILREFFN